MGTIEMCRQSKEKHNRDIKVLRIQMRTLELDFAVCWVQRIRRGGANKLIHNLTVLDDWYTISGEHSSTGKVLSWDDACVARVHTGENLIH